MKRNCIKQACWGCGEIGHMKRNCSKQICWGCGKQGHMRRNCKKRVCWSCGETGHIERNCGKEEEQRGEMTDGGSNERNIVAGVEEGKVCKGVVGDNNEVSECRKVEDSKGVVVDNKGGIPECRMVDDVMENDGAESWAELMNSESEDDEWWRSEED